MNEAVCQQLEEGGVKFIALRCAGFDKAGSCWVQGWARQTHIPALRHRGTCMFHATSNLLEFGSLAASPPRAQLLPTS